MPHAPAVRLNARQLRTLYSLGTASRWSDAALLDWFLSRSDSEAFNQLVERHGPMVLRVCREIAPDASAADDAFQATFLVLLRNARRIERRGSLGAWLYGVARRVSLKARARLQARQTRLELFRQRIGWDEASHRDDPARPEYLTLHEEVERLPDKYREPIVLCYLEGLTHEQAAERLGWPVGTVRGRLARARDRLRTRLTRDGAASMLLPAWVGSPVPEGLRRAIRDFVFSFTSNSTATSAIASPVVTSLASVSGGVSPMLGGKLALFAVNAALAGAVVVGAGWKAQQPPREGVSAKNSDSAVAAPGPPQNKQAQRNVPAAQNAAWVVAALGVAQQGARTNVVYEVADLVPDDAQGQVFMQAVDPLIQLLTSTVAPGTWIGRAPDGSVVAATEDGGERGSMTPFLLNKSLIIRHDPAVQTAIVERLRQLRRLTKLGAAAPSPPASPVGELMTATYAIHGLSLVNSELGPMARDPEPLFSLIASTVAPGTWKFFDANGQRLAVDDSKIGHVGSLGVSADVRYLRVTHTPAVHAQLAEFLERLRRLLGAELMNDVVRRQVGGDGKEPANPQPAPKAETTAAPKPPEWIGVDFDRDGALDLYLDGKPVPSKAGDVIAHQALPNQAIGDTWDDSDYRVDHPDLLRIRIQDNSGHRETYESTVSPSGTIDIPELGVELPVRGDSVRVIKVRLIESLRQKGDSDVDLGLVTVRDGKPVAIELAKSDRVVVQVAGYNSHLYMVEGAVKSPGLYPWIKGTNLLDALSRAGGLVGEPSSRIVRIIRAKPEPDGAQARDIRVDVLTQWLAGGEADKLPILEQGDRVIVLDRSGDEPKAKRPARATLAGSDSERLDAQQKRLDMLEKKLDRMLELLEKPGKGSPPAGGDTNGEAVTRY